MELGLKVNQSSGKLEPFLTTQNNAARKTITKTNNAACLSLPSRSLRKRAIKVGRSRVVQSEAVVAEKRMKPTNLSKVSLVILEQN